MLFEDKYSILGTKNTQYDGIFVTAVKTTGIFCRPSCRARIPKAENVTFYDTVQEAMENGFRPCKICKPVQMIGNTPAYIEGSRTSFSVSLHIIGTNFRKKVWDVLLDIRYGETVTYVQQAAAMNREKSVRAVASANAMNKISIVIPCHRVIGANGELSGYAGGLPKKQWMLDLEKMNSGRNINQHAGETFPKKS